tara:strand:+ start:11030 stop:12202 length:1173 start_codon:yes stop_codon:yes gene_type:complete
MPYFSFVLKSAPGKDIVDFARFTSIKIVIGKKYYSKNTHLWKLLNLKKNSFILTTLNKEKREKIKDLSSSILFCLPPSIGLGDAIEYGLAIDTIIRYKIFKKVGVSFTNKYTKIFTKYFNCKHIYGDIISEEALDTFDTIFHFTLEINELHFQKYNRQNIEKLITDYFSVQILPNDILQKEKITKIRNITIFPISNSPIRSMTISLLNFLIQKLSKEFNLIIILNNESKISNYIKKNIINKYDIKILNPQNIEDLVSIIEQISFGIFVDSGPLHVAKIFNKKGILIETTVDSKKLLPQDSRIFNVSNKYHSRYCHGPCGLIDLINYNNACGCYDSLRVSKSKIMSLNNLNSLQRGALKNNYLDFVKNPVNCQKSINNDTVLNLIRKNIDL